MSTRRQCWHCMLLVLLGGCGIAAQRVDKITPRDQSVLETHVQPYLDMACASIDCHGAGGRPLRLYSELGLRADATDRPQPISNSHDPKALTTQELASNCSAFAAVALSTGSPDHHLALLKPLALGAGGIHHVGGVHWADTTDPGYLCLRGWLVGDIKQDVGSECAKATAKLQQ